MYIFKSVYLGWLIRLNYKKEVKGEVKIEDKKMDEMLLKNVHLVHRPARNFDIKHEVGPN